jgi:hypothetical protein
MTLSDTQLLVLNAAAARPDKLVTRHKRLPGASLQKVCAALAKRGLLAELDGASADPEVLRVKTDFGQVEYAITRAGLAAIGVDDESPYGEDVPKDVRAGVDPALIDGPDNEPREDAPTAPTGATSTEDAAIPSADATAQPTATTAPRRGGLRRAAQAVLEAYEQFKPMDEPIAALRAALAGAAGRAGGAGRAPGAPRQPRAGTKQEAVLALLRRDEGATIAQIIDATGWQSHTVRGFLAGLKRKGITVAVLERVRQVGPGREGAKGSFSVYRITN